MIGVWIVLGIVGLVIALVATGHLLPARFRGEASVDVPVPAATAFRLVLDGPRVPTHGRARGVAPLPPSDGRPSWVEDLGGTRVTVVVAEAEPGRLARMRLTDAEAPVSTVVTVTLDDAAGGAGCRVTAHFDVEVAATSWHGPLRRWGMRLLGGARVPARSYVRRLAAAAAAGQAAPAAEVTPAIAPGPPATVLPPPRPVRTVAPDPAAPGSRSPDP